MLRPIANIAVQSILSTGLSILKPVNVVAKATLETTAGIASVIHVGKDKARRAIVPTHPVNSLTDPLTFNEALRDIHDIRTIEMRTIDKRVSIVEYKKEMGIPSAKDLFSKFAPKKEVVEQPVTA